LSLGAKCENALPPLVDVDILGMTSDLVILKNVMDCGAIVRSITAKPFGFMSVIILCIWYGT